LNIYKSNIENKKSDLHTNSIAKLSNSNSDLPYEFSTSEHI